MLSTKALYPQIFITPEGRKVRISTMRRALQIIRTNPDADYTGWNWFPTPGHHILREFRRGLHDRINRRAT